MTLKDEIDWLKELQPSLKSNQEVRIASEDFTLFVRAIRNELLDYVASLADGRLTKTEFLFKLSQLRREWRVYHLEDLP